MRIKQPFRFSFKAEPVWMLLFPLVTTGIGILIALFVILFRKFAS